MAASITLPPYSEIKNPGWILTERQMTFIDLTLLYSAPLPELWEMVFRTGQGPTRCEKNARSLLQSSDAREFADKREAQIRKHFETSPHYRSSMYSSAVTDLDDVADVVGKGSMEPVSLDDALSDLMPAAIKDLQNILRDKRDPNYADAFKMVLSKMMKDLNMEKQEVPPQRYLPEQCATCRYKAFCEDECVDECDHCRYKAYSIENGVKFTHKNQLDLTIENPR